MIKRYSMTLTSCGIGEFTEMTEIQDGEYVKYDDIKHLLEHSDNTLANIKKIITKQKDIDPKIVEIINDNFWELI